jgi:hypothetical protein
MTVQKDNTTAFIASPSNLGDLVNRKLIGAGTITMYP